MKRLISKSWIQVIVLGVLFGVFLIVVDSTTNLFSTGKKNKPAVYNGAVNATADEMYLTRVQYPEARYNFGKVKEGDTVLHKFVIMNIGEEPLMIYKTKGSCDCIKAYTSEKPILPGEQADINVYFKTLGRKGPQVRTVTINTNTEPADATLTLVGIVE